MPYKFKKHTISIIIVGLIVLSTALVGVTSVVKAGSGGSSGGSGGSNNNNPPVAILKGPDQWPKGKLCTFDGSNSYDPDGNSLTYEWRFCGNCEWVSSGSYPKKSKTFYGVGTWEISLKVTDSNGESDTDSYILTITVNEPPVANAGGGAYKRYFADKGHPLHVDGSGSYDPDPVVDQDGIWHGIEQYDWKWFDGDSWHNNIGPTPSHTYNTVGTYTITLRVHDYYGATDTDTATVYVTGGDPDQNEPPVAILDSDYYFANVGVPITFDGSQSYDSDGAITYHCWRVYDGLGYQDFVGNEPPTTFTYTYKYNGPSNGYLLVLTVRDNDCTYSHTSAHVFVGGGTPDLDIEKTDTPDPIYAGEELTYRIEICNHDPSLDPRIVDDYDENNITIIDTDGGIDNGDTIVWDHVDIPGGSCITYNVRAIVDECIPNGTLLKNKAYVEYEGKVVDVAHETTTILNNNICGFEIDKKVRLDPSDDSEIEEQSRWADERESSIGDTVRFRLKIQNNGDSIFYVKNITDILPKGLVYADNATVNGVSQEPDAISINNPTTLLWKFEENSQHPEEPTGMLEPGDKIIIEFDAKVTNCGSLTNEVVVFARADSSSDYDVFSDTAIVNVTCEPSINVEKYVKAGCSEKYYKEVEANIGDEVTFKIYINNTGDENLSDIKVEDILPDGIIYISNSSSPLEPDIIEGILIWSFKYLESGDTIVVEFTGEVVDCGNLSNGVMAQGVYINDNDGKDLQGDYKKIVQDKDEAYVNIECEPEQPDISLEKYVAYDCTENYQKTVNANIGDTVKFKLIVNNTGDEILYNVEIIDHLPDGLTYLSGSTTPAEPTFIDDYTMLWTFPQLNIGEKKAIIFLTEAEICGEWQNTAETTAQDEQQNQVSDVDDATIDIECPSQPDVKVEKYVKLNCQEEYQKEITANIGDTLEFKITVKNTGNTPLNITINDLLPIGLTYNNHATPWEPNETKYPLNGYIIYIWEYKNLPPENNLTITYQTIIDQCNNFVNAAIVEGKYKNQIIQNTSEAFITVECPQPDIKITKTHNVCGDCVDIGETITYTYTVTNTGTVTLYNIAVTDDKLELISLNTTTLEPGNWAVGTAQYTVTESDLPGPIVNIATAVGEDQFGTQVSDQDSQSIKICSVPDISLEKYVALDCSDEYQKSVDAEVGDYVKFKIFVNNTGGLTLYNIKVIDTLPSGLTYLSGSATPTPSDISGNVITWMISELAPGKGEIIQFSANVEDCGEFENVANVTAVDEYQTKIVDEDNAFVNVECPPEPCLEYDPQEYDFGFLLECEHASTTFDIWNGCEGILEYSLSWDCGWITSVTPSSGDNTGEHDTITVEIYTAGLHWGHTYTCSIAISSNGGNGMFNVTVTIGEPPDEPILAFSPDSYNFGAMNADETDSANFDIWNAGSGTLTYSISEDCPWLSVSSDSGSCSTGEHDIITVAVDTTGLTEGTHIYDIQINSNGGNGTFHVTVTIGGSGSKPTVELIKPKDGKIYFRDKELLNFPRTIIIGPITIQANATDSDGTIERVEFLIDGELKDNMTEGPYSYKWNERAFGFRTITVKAYDNDGDSKETDITVLIFNLGLTR